MASAFVSSPAEVVVIDSRTRSGTVTLPGTNTIPYRVLNFKDQYGTFSNSTLTISTQVGESFDDGTTSKTFSNAFSYLSLYAVSSKWMVMNATQTVQQTISSLTVNQLNFGTGAGWVQFGPLQATVVSSIQTNTNDAYVNNLYVGGQSTINDILFYGLQGNYNNSAIAEISTGGGTQELLFFKGSTTTDRFRFQTTGTFVVETGVSARLFSTNTLNTLSNATPAFIINTSSNVGIQTNNPGATLDVAGTGRFQTLSTLAFNVSSMNGQLYWGPEQSSFIGLGSIGYVSSPSLVSTTVGLQQFVSTSITAIPYMYTGTTLYLNYSIPVGSYRELGTQLLSIPGQQTVTTTLGANTNNVFIAGFESDFSVPSFIPSGFWDVTVFSLASGTEVFMYASIFIDYNGVETLIASTSNVPQLVPQVLTEFTTTVPVPYTSISTSGKVLVKLFANHPAPATRTLSTLYQDGTYSHVQTTFGVILDNSVLTSTTVGLGTLGYVSTASLVSTVGGLTFSGSTLSLSSGSIFTSSITGTSLQFATVSTLALNISSINGSVYTPGGGSGGLTTLPSTVSSFAFLTSSLQTSTLITTQTAYLTTAMLGNTALIPQTTLDVVGEGTFSYQASLTSNAYGKTVDTLILKSPIPGNSNATTSLMFGTSTVGFPLARIGAFDYGYATTAGTGLVFQVANASTNSSLSGVSAFSYSGSLATYNVGAGIYSLEVLLWGAGGGGGGGGFGGPGAFVRGTIPVTPGQQLRILVGKGGLYANTTSYGGGGSGGGVGIGAAGGGRSAIQTVLTPTITSLVANGTTVVYTTSAAHGLVVGEPVFITNLSPSGYNGTFVVTAITTSSPFTFTVNNTTTGASSGTGNIVAELVTIGGGGGSASNTGGGSSFGGYGGLVTGGNGGAGGGGGGSQTSGGSSVGGGATSNGSLLQGGSGGPANGGGGGGGGYFGGGAGLSFYGSGGGGGSSYLSNVNVTSSGQTTSGSNAPGNTDPYYVPGVAIGGPYAGGTGGDGYVVILASASYVLSEAMRIDYNNNVGINKPVPSTTLDVGGTTRTLALQVGIVSTVNAVQYSGLFGNYNNTVLSEISTGAGTQELLVFKGSSASDRVRVQTTGTFVVETGVSTRLWNSNTSQTLSNVTPAFMINTSSNVGIQTNNPGATLDVAGTIRGQIVSTLALTISSINGTVYSAGGSGGLTTLPSTTSTFVFLTSSLVASTATIGILSTLILTASTATLNQVTASTVTANSVTLNTNPSWILTSPIQTLAVSTNTIWTDQAYTNTNTVTTEIASTITTNALTLGVGSTWIQTAPLLTSVVSSIFMFANSPFFDTVNIGSVSTMNSLEFAGLFNAYNNTVLAEVSTGAGTQELLVFKGSSASDRVRIQTTGAFVVETGVSARLFNSNTTQTLSNTTPAFVINTSSNVGIQTANPGATLDVAGIGRFQTLSSLALFASSIVAPSVFAAQFFTF